MYNPPFRMLLVAAALLAVGAAAILSARLVLARDICFPDNSAITDCLSDPFADYWEANGGLSIFGYPVRPARQELNADLGMQRLTQWTERNRLESHPENVPPYNVLIGRVGAERLAQLGRDPAAEGREAGPRATCRWFAETGHNVCDQASGLGFKTYWESNGLADPLLDSYGQSLALFGLPLTEARMEVSATDGKTYLTQWFERARLEWHPENPDEFKVLRGLLGNELVSNPGEQPPPIAPAPPLPNFGAFGVEINRNTVGEVVAEARDAQLAWVRYNGILWPEVEPTRGQRDWSQLAQVERELRTLADQDVEIMLIVRHAPAWALRDPSSACSPIAPEALDDFASFVGEMVQRYSTAPYNVRYWELGNEPDVDPALIEDTLPFGCWGDRGDPYYGGGYYAEMLKRVYPAVKAANPEAQVVVGGLLLDCDPNTPPEGKDCLPARFLEGILRNGGGEAFDMVGYHAYTYWFNERHDWDREQRSWQHRGGALLGKADYISSLLAAYGLRKPVVANEVGLLCSIEQPKCLNNGFREAQANYLVRVYTRAWANGVAGSAWYTLNGPGWRLGGLVTPGEQPTPGYLALRFLGTTLQGARPAATLASDRNGLEGYEFAADGVRYQVYWNNADANADVPLPPGTRAIYDMLGQEVTPASLAAGEPFGVGFEPVLLEIRP